MNHETPPKCSRQRFYPRAAWSVPAARNFTQETLTAWSLSHRADDVLLCVSELATNAVLHGTPPSGGFRLRLVLAPNGPLRIEVHDGDGGSPRIPDSAQDSEHGRGLLLVDILADTWGSGADAPGKVVWCEFATAEALSA